MLLPIALVAAGAVALIFLFQKPDREIRDIQPDEPLPAPAPSGQVPDKTGYRYVTAILPGLKRAAEVSGTPLGLHVGWIALESGGHVSNPYDAKPKRPAPPAPIPTGNVSADTNVLGGERGLYQLTPAESKMLGVDHERLSTDVNYSIDAGVKLVQHYAAAIDHLGIAPKGSTYFWMLVKLAHSMGAGQVKKIADQAAGEAKSWDALKAFALDMKIRGPQPKKWFPFVDKIHRIGAPFGFGTEMTTVSGLPEFADIPDPLDVIQPKS